MPTSPIQGATPIQSASLAPASRQDRGLSSLRSEDFFKILVTELQQQDPMKPNETSDMISQVSQIRSIELSGQLTDTLGQLAQQQKASGASDLIGKYVQAAMEGEDGQAFVLDGVVTGVQFASDGSATLELDSGMAVRAADVIEVTTPELHEQRMQDALLAPQAAAAKNRLKSAYGIQQGIQPSTPAPEPSLADWFRWPWKL